MIRVAICEDDEVCCRVIRQYIEACNINADIQVFSGGEQFCGSIQEGAYFEIILMDIDMGDDCMSGIDAAKWLRRRSNFDTTMIIFVTSHVELAEESFHVNPFYFLRKPIDGDKLMQILHWAVERLEEGQQYFEYRKYQSVYRVPIGQIRCFYQNNRGVYLITESESERIRGRISQVEERLRQMNADCFCRISRSCIINLEHVKLFCPQKVILMDDREFPVSESCMKALRGKIGNLLYKDDSVSSMGKDAPIRHT